MLYEMIIKEVQRSNSFSEPLNRVRDENGKLFTLGNTTLEKAYHYAQLTINYFNSTLRPHESERVLVEVKPILKHKRGVADKW